MKLKYKCWTVKQCQLYVKGNQSVPADVCL